MCVCVCVCVCFHRRDSSGQPLLYSGVPWRPHLLLMVVSAKLLSDTENMLQVGLETCIHTQKHVRTVLLCWLPNDTCVCMYVCVCVSVTPHRTVR